MIDAGMGPVFAFCETAIKCALIGYSIEAGLPRRHDPARARRFGVVVPQPKPRRGAVLVGAFAKFLVRPHCDVDRNGGLSAQARCSVCVAMPDGSTPRPRPARGGARREAR